MPKLYSSSHIIAILKSFRFVFVSQRGSHCKYIKDDKTVIVPHPKSEIPVGTFMSIVRQSGLKKSDF